MNKQSITIIIPSRDQPLQQLFLERAVASIRAQTVIENFEVTLLVGVDAGKIPEGDLAQRLSLTFVESKGCSQAAALNAAIRLVRTDYVAFLEDDDQWFPLYLEVSMRALSMGAFVSSTQVEYDENGELLRIFDFPTPSGWIMTKSALQSVGEFNEEFRFHMDNEWLGRLCEAKIARLHLVEETAPNAIKFAHQVRPWLANVIGNSGGFTRLARHESPYPLVRRLVHSKSGMAQIETNPVFQEISRDEYARLVKRFGRVPW